MKKYFFVIPVLAILFTAFISSCNKINLPTDLGRELIPTVDNITTFDTTISVEAFNHIFTNATDSFRSIFSDEQFLGHTNDPIFGTTEAKMYFQLLSLAPLRNVPGKRYVDSVVLILSYRDTYGDSTLSQNVEVSEISPGTPFNPPYNATDSSYRRIFGYPFNTTFPTTGILGSKTVVPKSLNDSIRIQRPDTPVVRQLRIPLAKSFGQRILNLDSATIANDTLFKAQLNGFAVQSTGGNGLMGFNLGTSSLAIYYRHDNVNTAGDMDTTVANFIVFNKSATANYVNRNYAGTQIVATANDNIADPFVFVQNTPGTYAILKADGLKSLRRYVVHLAELQIESIYDTQDSLFYPPLLFLDMYDSSGTTSTKYKSVPYSLDGGLALDDPIRPSYYYITPTGLTNFGAYPYFKKDPSGNTVKQWKFNISRYVQNLVKGTQALSSFRLYTTPETFINNGSSNADKLKILVQSINSPVKGRVRLGGGNHPNQSMKIRVVYSKT